MIAIGSGVALTQCHHAELPRRPALHAPARRVLGRRGGGRAAAAGPGRLDSADRDHRDGLRGGDPGPYRRGAGRLRCPPRRAGVGPRRHRDLSPRRQRAASDRFSRPSSASRDRHRRDARGRARLLALHVRSAGVERARARAPPVNGPHADPSRRPRPERDAENGVAERPRAPTFGAPSDRHGAPAG